MRTKILTIIATSIAIACFTQIANCQTSTNDLTVSAETQLLIETNSTRVFLAVHLINSSDHDVTVLTKHLNVQTEVSTNRTTFVVGYGNSTVTHDGHPIIPSLYDFSPVTLKPNEEALVSQEVLMANSSPSQTNFVVQYTISSEWAKRFSLWSGTAESQPCNPRVRKAR
ncbi:MAG: hypothetical protein QOD03_1347 [Verrucomicrobiota bacterium]|jgi:hypothetical protein